MTSLIFYYYYYYYPGELSIWTRRWLGNQGIEVRFPAGSKYFFYSTASIKALGPTQSTVYWLSGTIFPREKLPGLEADH
jgi:hypothetical protein